MQENPFYDALNGGGSSPKKKKKKRKQPKRATASAARASAATADAKGSSLAGSLRSSPRGSTTRGSSSPRAAPVAVPKEEDLTAGVGARSAGARRSGTCVCVCLFISRRASQLARRDVTSRKTSAQRQALLSAALSPLRAALAPHWKAGVSFDCLVATHTHR